MSRPQDPPGVAVITRADAARSELEGWLKFSRVEFCGLSAASALLTDSLDVVAQARATGFLGPVVFIPENSSERLAIAALRCGCTDYVAPRTRAAVLEALERCFAASFKPDHPAALADDDWLVGGSREICRLREVIRQLARTPTNVLITGETGTGKELVAQLIHRNSSRRNCPIVAINCAALPDALLESELFGYERGAFTGATAAHAGKLREAHGGTVFLDEIAEMTTMAQAKILRVIETKYIERLGGRRGTPVDFRVLAATNQNLKALITERRFRQDLYFRLNVASIEIPPLRERKADIPALASKLIADTNQKFDRAVTGIDKAFLDSLIAHDWPGNVRELRNVIEAAFAYMPPDASVLAHGPDFDAPLGADNEKQRLLHVLESTHWNKTETARQLRWSRMTLYRKMAKYRVFDMKSPTAKRRPATEFPHSTAAAR